MLTDNDIFMRILGTVLLFTVIIGAAIVCKANVQLGSYRVRYFPADGEYCDCYTNELGEEYCGPCYYID